MKKFYWYAGMLAAGMLAFSACSDENDPIPGGGEDNPAVATGEQVIILDMQDTDVLSTKSRPLYSTTNQGAEDVTDVKLLVFKHSTDEGGAMSLEKVLTISQWDQMSSDYSYGRKYSYELKGDEKLENGASYTILAVGQDESNTDADATSFAPYQIEANNPAKAWISQLSLGAWDTKTWNAGSNVSEGFLKTVARPGKNEAEIFSGISKPVTLTMDGGFTADVLLKRQVAGVLGYFSRIPAFVLKAGGDGNNIEDYEAVKKIRLVASAKNTRLDLTYALSDQKDDATEVGQENAVNGFTPATADAKFGATAAGAADNAFTVYEIDLTEWFKVANPSNNDASYWYDSPTCTAGMEIPSLGEPWADAENYPAWVNALDQANSMPHVATNSVLAGEFVIPFEKDVDNETFELQLLGGQNDAILKTWKVKLDDMSLNEELGDNEYAYNIYRNHLYQIGQRGGGDSPVDPGEDPDDPQPLDKDQELTIKINDNWEFIHDMEIE